MELLPVVVAQGGDPAGAERLVEYGVLGILVLALAAFARAAYLREANRADRLEAELREVRDRVEERVVPALERAIDAVERSAAADRPRGGRLADELYGRRP